jgi:hypothetical protein
MAEGSLPRSDQAAWTWAILSAVAVLIAIGIISVPPWSHDSGRQSDCRSATRAPARSSRLDSAGGTASPLGKTGMCMRHAQRVGDHPRAAASALGDVLPTDRDGTGFVVERLDPPHAMVLVIRERGTVTSSVFVLREHDRGTRLLCRLRLTAPRTTVGVRYRLLMELGHVPTTLSMLTGIRRRVASSRPGS